MSRKRYEDLTGQLFTRWFINSYNSKKSKETGYTYWNVTCTNDGNKGCVRADSLKSGKSKSCGCLSKEFPPRERLNITDQIYGRLLALVTDWYKTKETGFTHWWCQCEDNNIVSVRLCNLKNGHTQSCGCLVKEDLTGQLFTRWYVESYNSKKSKEMGISYWNVVCIKDDNKNCLSANCLKQGKSTSCGCLSKEKSSKRMSGENNPFWKGGISPLYQIIRSSAICKEFHRQVLKKANYTCQLTKEVNIELNVHHKKSFAKILKENNITTTKEAENCEELWNENNVVVLSEKWHTGVKTNNPLAFHRLYGKHNFTKEDFYKWFNEFKIDFKKEITS